MGSDFSGVMDDTLAPRGVSRRIIYTLGTSTRELQAFMEILDSYEIVRVVDVRRFPTSRLDHFRKENLEAALKARGLQYLYLGEELGGYRKGGYEAHMESNEFGHGIEALISVATDATTVFICAERLPWKCHRRFIGEVLERKDWHVVHLIEKDRTWAGRQDGRKDRSSGP